MEKRYPDYRVKFPTVTSVALSKSTIEKSTYPLVSIVLKHLTNRGSVVVLCRLYQLGDQGSIPGRTSTHGINEQKVLPLQ